jgi:chemotaxis protein CheZ
MVDINAELFVLFKKLNIELASVDAAAMGVADLIKKCVKEEESELYQGVKGIGDRIQETKKEIAGIIPEGVVVDAKIELDAVVSATEDATNKILDAVEQLQKLTKECPDKELGQKIAVEISHIFEACNFQDLTGQRIKKVMGVLKYIEGSIGGMLSSFGDETTIRNDKRADAHLMNGPQLDTQAPNQDDVDRLFDSA